MGLVVATLLWDKNRHSLPFSRMYDESWANKLHAGFRRHLPMDFRFVVFTDREREFDDGVEQIPLAAKEPDYGTCIEPYGLDEPMILTGLDTLVVGDVSHLADYCLRADTIALPRDPYKLSRACNGVALVPKGHGFIYTTHRGENDMDWMRAHPHKFLDDLFPGHVVSYKGSVQKKGVGDSRIIYFHGVPKMHQMLDVPFVKDHWRT